MNEGHKACKEAGAAVIDSEIIDDQRHDGPDGEEAKAAREAEKRYEACDNESVANACLIA